MAETATTIQASPEDIFAVLLDAHSYDHWVVGCKAIRAVDESWPAPGSRFHHTVGFGPLDTQDTTTIVESDPPRRLSLEARARPAGVASVVFTLEPEGSATKVTIIERPIRGVAATIDNPVLDKLVDGRNVETLRRLKKRVEEKGGPPAGDGRASGT